jgi:hypothetical protein
VNGVCGTSGGVWRRWDHDHALVLEAELGGGFVGQRLGGDDHVRRALQREVTQAQVHAAGAQTLAAAGERVEVVDRHDHRARAVQHRALQPRRVKHLGAAGTMGLEDLVIALAGDVAQRL